jgi:hypothetical protein
MNLNLNQYSKSIMREHLGLIGVAASTAGGVESKLHLLDGLTHSLIQIGTVMMIALTVIYYGLRIRDRIWRHREDVKEAARQEEISKRKGKGMGGTGMRGFSLMLVVVWIAGMAPAFGEGTNGTAATYGTTAAANPWGAMVADDARRLVYDFLTGFPWSGILQTAFAAYLGAKGLKNYTRLGRAGRLGSILRVIALEAQDGGATPVPSQTETRSVSTEISEQQTKTKGQQ